MASTPRDLLQIQTPSFNRVIDLYNHGHTQYPRDEKEKAEKIEKNIVAEVIYPRGKVVISRSENREAVIIQNTIFIPVSKNKKKSLKRPIIQLSLDNNGEDRFYDDGSLVHVPDNGGSGVGGFCKVAILQKDDSREVVVSFNGASIPPPSTPAPVVEEGPSNVD